MLFNSTEFVFAFFPVTVALFLVFGGFSRTWALGWLICASLVFYAWWNPMNLLIIGPSIVVNFLFAKAIQRHAEGERSASKRRLLLVAGIAFNVVVLGYFKYFNFATASLNDVFDTNFALRNIALPLGISFITFQEIAFLIDVHGRRIESFTFRKFCLFILFFPQLIAGPIVHYRETMPQFDRGSGRFDKTDFSVGLTLFFFGLFKKVVLADGIASYVTPIFAASATDGGVSLFFAWAAAIGFTLQIYFDFSGYSDMAIGLARCFGIKLPLNFDSPLKASSIIDFWLRWHVTLTRFLTAYIYNPVALMLTRRRVAKRLPMLGRQANVGAFLQVLAGPTLLTMFISGLWHGAGWLFVLWGLVHGVYISINHAWRILATRVWHDKLRYEGIMRPVGFCLTFVSVVFAMVLFRSSTTDGAIDLIRGMVGLNGVSLPRPLLEPLGIADSVSSFVTLTAGGATDFILTCAWLFGLLVIALGLPNSLQITARYESALDIDERPAHTRAAVRWLAWNPSIPWAIAVSGMAAAAVLKFGAHSEFLYWQF